MSTPLWNIKPGAKFFNNYHNIFFVSSLDTPEFASRIMCAVYVRAHITNSDIHIMLIQNVDLFLVIVECDGRIVQLVSN